MTDWVTASTLRHAAALVAAGACPVSGGVALLSEAFEVAMGDRAVDILPVVPRQVFGTSIGAGASLAAVASDAALAATAPAVVAAAAATGTPAVRRQATLGGTLGLRGRSTDLFAALTVHDAVVGVIGIDGYHETPLPEFLLAGPGTRIVVGVRLRRFGFSTYRRFAATAGPGVPLATVAAMVLTDGEIRAYAGAVGTDARAVRLDADGQPTGPLRDDAWARSDYRTALTQAMYWEVVAAQEKSR